jgi:hypothetical protein
MGLLNMLFASREVGEVWYALVGGSWQDGGKSSRLECAGRNLEGPVVVVGWVGWQVAARGSDVQATRRKLQSSIRGAGGRRAEWESVSRDEGWGKFLGLLRFREHVCRGRFRGRVVEPHRGTR